jgi:hypothetical protein
LTRAEKQREADPLAKNLAGKLAENLAGKLAENLAADEKKGAEMARFMLLHYDLRQMGI